MSSSPRAARHPMLRLLQQSFHLFRNHKKGTGPDYDELIGRHLENKYDRSRRQFLYNGAKASAFVGLAGFAQACSKMEDVVPGAGEIGRALRQGAAPRIAIVGGGIAGLACAYELKMSGFTSTIYEASNRAGGRILSKQDFVATGVMTECGGEFIDTSHRNMLKYATDFGLPLIDTMAPSESGLKRDTFIIDGRSYSETDVINAFQPYANRIASDVSSLPTYFAYDNYTAAVLRFDQMSISGYFDSIGMPTASFLRKGLENAYLTEYGLEVNQQTAINFLYLFYINPGNGSYQIFGSSDERYKVLGGNQRIVDALYNNLRTQVVLNASLTRITKSSTNVYTLRFANGTSVQAEVVVLTLPFTLLRSVDLTQLALPSWKTNAIRNLGYGTNAKLILGFRSRPWRTLQDSGYIFTNGSTAFPSTYIQTGWDSSQLQPTTNGAYTVFQGGNQGVALSLTQTNTFLQQMETIWPGTTAQYNNTSKLVHWPSWQYSLGSYSCWKVGQVTTIKGAEGAAVGELYFAGEHTSSVNQGYMEGGAETGKNVAKSIALKYKV